MSQARERATAELQPFPEVEEFLAFFERSDRGSVDLMPVRIGVIGAGALGFHHTRILRDVPGAQLVGFHEANARARQHGERRSSA